MRGAWSDKNVIQLLLRCCVVCTALAGCVASTRPPERLFALADEMDFIRLAQQSLVDQYYGAVRARAFDEARALRNEIISQRLYAIDLQYSTYEAALTRERQEVGFATLTTAEGLSTAATLATDLAAKSVLSGLTTAVIATKGHYESEVLLAQTMRTIQKQMRASRNNIATHISARMNQTVIDYPLAAAMSDVEDYYRAGTLTSGVIDASTTVGQEEKHTESVKQEVAREPLAARPAAAEALLTRDTVVRQLVSEPSAPLPKSLPMRVELGSQDITDFQNALCQEPDGKIGPKLLAAISQYVGGLEGNPPRQITEINRRNESLVRIAVQLVPNCKTAGFVNAFEVGAYGVPAGGVSALSRLNELQGQLGVPVAQSFNAATRGAIEKYRIDNRINPELRGQVDHELRRRLTP